MIAFRFGSNTNSMRISLLPEDPGLSSFIEGMRLDPFILPTIGRLRSGPCSSNNDTAEYLHPRFMVERVQPIGYGFQFNFPHTRKYTI